MVLFNGWFVSTNYLNKYHNMFTPHIFNVTLTLLNRSKVPILLEKLKNSIMLVQSVTWIA